MCKHFDRSGSNQENSEKHHLFSDISPDSEKIPKIKKNKTNHKTQEICPEQEAITKLI